MKVFNELDEGFICENCGKNVNKLVYSSRDHCPYCLYSKHVDINPGDRANKCEGLLKPIGIEKYKDRYYYVEQFEEREDCVVFHYIMAKEGTEAGNYYNNLTIELIKNQFNDFNNRKAINIPEQIKNIFSELSVDILGEKAEVNITGKDNNIIKLVEKNNYLKKRGLNTMIRVQNAYINQNEIYLKNKRKFEPKYSLYFYKEYNEEEDEYENYLLLRLEIPGNIARLTARSTNPKTEKFNGIVIKGIKKKMIFKKQTRKILQQ